MTKCPAHQKGTVFVAKKGPKMSLLAAKKVKKNGAFL